MSSPAVRGENLRFSENGVRDVISRVLLPLLNSHRFFVGQTSLLLKRAQIRFQYDEKAPKSPSVMDRWILSRCHSLINHIRTEMSEYRLYAVIPKLLEIVDELTNWYIRFNRKRLKGEFGTEDTVVALNTLFEALYTMCLAMVNLVPQAVLLRLTITTGFIYTIYHREHISIATPLLIAKLVESAIHSLSGVSRRQYGFCRWHH